MKPNLKEGEHFIMVDEFIWNYFKNRYGLKAKDHEILRMGIIVNEETEECLVEIYLRHILLLPL
jgi:hypothetical protein